MVQHLEKVCPDSRGEKEKELESQQLLNVLNPVEAGATLLSQDGEEPPPLEYKEAANTVSPSCTRQGTNFGWRSTKLGKGNFPSDNIPWELISKGLQLNIIGHTSLFPRLIY